MGEEVGEVVLGALLRDAVCRGDEDVGEETGFGGRNVGEPAAHD